MLQLGCREGLELRKVWSNYEAVEASEWLREDVMDVFQGREEGVAVDRGG